MLMGFGSVEGTFRGGDSDASLIMKKNTLPTLALLAGGLWLGHATAFGQAGAPLLIPGFLKFEAYNGITGTPVQGLLDDTVKYPGKPDEVLYMSAFDTRTIYPNDSHENYGARITGVVIPPTSGDYEFFLRSDDASQLFFNKAGDALAGLEMIAEEAGCCNAFQEPGATQTSAPITLQAGKAYAIQAIFKEGTGGDFCQVAWRKVGDTTAPALLKPIPSAFVATSIPAAGSITITKQPTNLTAAQNDVVSLGMQLTVSQGPVVVQWQRDGVNVPELTGLTVPLGPLALSQNGAKYRAVISIPGATVTSAEAVLTVTPDITKPTILSVAGSAKFDSVTVEFSEAVTEASASKASNYTLDGGVTISSVTVLSPTTVRLATSKQTLGASYTLTVKDIIDTANNASAVDTKLAFKAFGPVTGGLKVEAFYGFTGGGVADLQTFMESEKYLNGEADAVAYVSQFTSRLAFPDSSNGIATRENYGGRISGWIVPPETAEYEFFIRSDDASILYLSTDDTVEKAAVIAQENGCCGPFEDPGVGDNGDGTFPTSALIKLNAGTRYYIAAIWKEGGGGDYCDVAWRKKGDTAVARALPYIQGSVLQTLGAPGALTAPTARISAPANDTVYEIGAPVTLETSAVAASGKKVVQVDYLEQGKVIATSSVSPYSVTFFGVAEGAHSYTARVTDSAGVFVDSAPVSIAVGVPTKVIDIVKIDDKALWRYDRSGQELGTAWREIKFDDSKWPQGKALIADESTTTVEPIRTAISRLNDEGVYVQTFYFRYTFDFNETVNPGTKLKLRHVVDDGAVFYLNGVEIHRFGIAADAAFDSTTSFGGHENIYEGPYDVPPSLLVKGQNVLAVEVHQSGGSSSDMVFGAELVATVPCVIRDVALLKIDETTVWKYDRSGQELGTAWRENKFDDSKWPQGKALIADESTTTVEPIRTAISRFNEEGVYVQTFYFRSHFNFTGTIAGSKLKMRHVVDDGAVIYLNGKEIHRFGVAADAAFDSTTSFAGHENVYEGPYDVPLDTLLPGDNVVAVEVHQSGGSSSDMVFGLELVATITDCGGAVETPVVKPATLSVSRNGANLVVSWTEGGTLQVADSVKGPWSDVAGASPQTVSTATAAKFYRVKK